MQDRFRDERWREVEPYLDRALDLTVEERAAWLAGLRADDSALAADVQALLDRHGALKDEGFMESAPLPSQPSLAGQAAGAYTLRSLIGQGGMGSVWLADRSDGRFEGRVAVKLLNASRIGREGEARFRREGNILARLRHPHIAHLVDAGLSASGQPYLVLEHVDGEHIDAYCDARRLDIEARLRLFLDVLGAVAHAHAHLIVHRDIKPSNVLVGRDANVKLLDFGIAKLLEPEPGDGDAVMPTREGEVALTPEYAAPEQVTGGPVSTATDVYALGVLLYSLLAGQHPTSEGARSAAAVIKAVVDIDARPVSLAVVSPGARTATALTVIAAKRGTTPRKLGGLLAGDLENIVGKALRKRPEERYSSVAALADDLRRYLRHEPVSARPDSLTYRCAKFVRRNRTGVELAALLAFALGVGMVGTVTQARRAEVQRVRADQEARAASRQRDFALRQLSRAEAINDLNMFVLSDATQSGRQFTVDDLLARAERSVERRQSTGDDNRVELLLAIAVQYQYLDEHAKARELATRAYELAARSSDVALRAKAACTLASTIAQGGDGERAEQLLQEADRELPKDPEYALHRVHCLHMGSVVAQERGDANAGIERAEAAQRMLRESGFDSPFLDFGIAMRLASAYGFAGRHHEAVASFQDAFGRISSLGRDDTRTASTVLNNWANELLALGRPLQAERLFRRAILASSTTEEGSTPLRLNNLARALRDLHRLPEAARYAELACAKARQMGQKGAVEQSLVVRASVYRQQGDLRRSAEMLRALEPREKQAPAGHVLHAFLAAERGYIAEARGDVAAALQYADRAVAIAEAGTQRAVYLSRFLLRRSELKLQLALPDPARADAESALRLDLEAAGPASFSRAIGLDQLALGRALQAQGRSDDALAAFAAAVRHLRPSVGEQHPATRSAMALVTSLTPRPHHSAAR